MPPNVELLISLSPQASSLKSGFVESEENKRRKNPTLDAQFDFHFLSVLKYTQHCYILSGINQKRHIPPFRASRPIRRILTFFHISELRKKKKRKEMNKEISKKSGHKLRRLKKVITDRYM